MLNTSNRFFKIKSLQGVEFYGVKETKFKTDTLNIFFVDELDRKTAALNALLPAVLKRGSANWKTVQDISKHLESLYGCLFDCGIHKKGEFQIIHFYLEGISDSYAGDPQVFEDSVRFLLEIIQKPFFHEGYFLKEYVELEKQNMKHIIEGRKNDKGSYALERCNEEMCREEKFGIHEYGELSDYDFIDEFKLTSHYQEHFSTLPAVVFLSGDYTEDKARRISEMFTSLERKDSKAVKYSWEIPPKIEEKEVVEQMKVNQGKLCMGFRTFVNPIQPEYYAAMVYNSILGGGMHSKLFQNVREKEGLAYYAYSRMEKFKGLLVISCGIEITNQEKVKNIILEQMEEIKRGNISNVELESSKKTIETAIKALQDSQLQTVDYYFGQSILGTEDTLEKIIEKVNAVCKEDIVEIAKRLQMDTVYFLTAETMTEV